VILFTKMTHPFLMWLSFSAWIFDLPKNNLCTWMCHKWFLSLALSICWRSCLWPHTVFWNWSPLIMMPSQLSLWIVFPQNSMVTFYLSFLMCVICWDISSNCKVWIENMMVMLGASCRPETSRMHLDWDSEQPNSLDICVVRMILLLCCNVLLHTMKLDGVVIVPSYW
jgi:hypothetical protein